MCEAMGIDWSRQRKKIMDDKVLSAVVAEMPTTASDGKNYKTTMLPLSMISGWLFKINPKRVALTPPSQKFRIGTIAHPTQKLRSPGTH